MNVVNIQRVGKIAYAVGKKFISVEEQNNKHRCVGCVAAYDPNADKTLAKFKAQLCSQLPNCGGVIWEEL